MKDRRYNAPEAEAVARVIDGLRQVHADDVTLLEQGSARLEALARSFASTGEAARGRTPRPREPPKTSRPDVIRVRRCVGRPCKKVAERAPALQRIH
jgi:hypothetical protein